MRLENHEYEKALLGCILLDNRVLEELPITPRLFDNQDCQAVFAEIQRTVGRKAVANIYEIGLMRPDLASFIAELTDIPSAANAKFYADELAELSRRRGIAHLARALMDQAQKAETTQEILEYADQALTEIADLRETGYQQVSAFMPEVVHQLEWFRANQGKLSGVDTGFDQLNRKTNGWQKQELIIIGARPGAGKTSIALNMSSAAIRSGKTVGFFSAEMSGKSIIMRLMADWGPIAYNGMVRGQMSASEYQALQEAAEKLFKARMFINDTPAISLPSLMSEARRMKRKEGVDIVFVDYLSLVSNERRDVPRHEQVAQISKSLKTLARELDIPVIVLSQLTREAQGERPKLSQLRDSGAVEQDADIVILLHNLGWTDENRTKVKINLIIEKNRNGPTGDTPMMFVPAWMRFSEVAQEWERGGRE